MPGGEGSGEKNSARRGLATIALLKVNFDAGHDHISMFEPFVLDCLPHIEDGTTAETVCAAVSERHQLAMPVNTLRTLLGRAVNRGFLRREGGRYFRTEKDLDFQDLLVARQRVEQRQAELADAFRVFARLRGLTIENTEDALAMLLDFLERYHVSMALDPTGEPAINGGEDPTEDQTSRRQKVRTAAFLQETILTGGKHAAVIQEMLEGFILQNTLLLKDISTATRPFKNLRVFFDSLLLFGVLGYRGAAEQVAMKELLALLRDSGVSFEVFEPTVREMRRILNVYEDRIGTDQGRRTLYPTDLTRYFLTNHYTPSDIHEANALLEKNLRGLGFNIRELPSRRPELTLDEEALGKKLAAEPGGENVPRVVHDIDCVAGVVQIRRGKTSASLDTAVAVFVSANGRTVRNVTTWYKEEGEGGFPPIVHFLLLSNLAWLKRPATASKLKLHELVALCAAALRPSREAWNAFLRHLRRLEESGELSSDEATAIVASSLTDTILGEEEIGEDADSSTLTEVVDRVKAAYKLEAEREVLEARGLAEQSAATVAQLRLNIERRARGLGRFISWAIVGILGASLISGVALTIVESATGSKPSALGLALALVPLAVASLLSVFTGFHLKGWRGRLEERVANLLRRWLAGTP